MTLAGSQKKAGRNPSLTSSWTSSRGSGVQTTGQPLQKKTFSQNTAQQTCIRHHRWHLTNELCQKTHPTEGCSTSDRRQLQPRVSTDGATAQPRTSSCNIFIFLLHGAVILEKLTGFRSVKKFPTFHRTRRFITAFTSVRQLSLSWASPIQSIYPHPTSGEPS